jgi:polysaccharide biosynthesis protein PslH
MERLVLGPEAEDEMDDAGDQRRASVVVLTPIAPAATGNGLAMRAHLMICAAARHHNVHLFVLPIAGRIPGAPSIPPGVVAVHELPLEPLEPREIMVDLLSDPWWRERLAEIMPMPTPSSFASPGREAEVTELLNGDPVRAVVSLRLSTAMLGTSLSQRLGIPLIVDADDDDVDLLVLQGRGEEAAAWERLARVCFRSATLVTVAGAPDMLGMQRRYGTLPVSLVPNAVGIPSDTIHTQRLGQARALFLANLTYQPNIEAAQWLIREVLPRLDESWTIDLVGSAAPEVQALAGPRVVVYGHVPDVATAYHRADVALAPLLVGSGTRVKVLEAMAYRRPVVATTVGCAGIDVVPDRHLLVADRPEDFARQVASLRDEALSSRLVQAAAEIVANLYDSASVIKAAGRLISSVAASGA